jgi:multidrug efflux pump subunit AcrA (membrane-fusion protein)
MFARVRVPGSPPYEALLVPDSAVGTEQTRKFLFVVGADNKVQQKYVELGQATKDNLRVIKNGLGPDDRVIVNGLMRARAGIVVSPKMEGEANAAPGSAPKAPAAPAKK